MIAIEYLHMLPKNDLANSTVRAQYDVTKLDKGQEKTEHDILL